MSSVNISDCLQSVSVRVQIPLFPSEQKQKVKPRLPLTSSSTNEACVLLKQRERARTVRTAANTETTRCYICIWCDISLPMLPICSLPANKMDVIISNKDLVNHRYVLSSVSDLIRFIQYFQGNVPCGVEKKKISFVR